MPGRATIALFDIDGTLVSCGGAGRRAMERAFAELGVARGATEFDYGGMTDVAIVRRTLLAASRDDAEPVITSVLERYLSFLRDEVPRSTNYTVLPGVREMVERARAIASMAVGLGTGNIARGAEVKLTPGGLFELFDFGGFGSDHEDRAELLRIGAERGAARAGCALAECRVVVIGDTPRDVTAAHAIGAVCIGVATGQHAVDVLVGAGADVVVADLRDARALEALIGGVSRGATRPPHPRRPG